MYLDRPGLLGLWRETLLALAVLQGKTKGYKNHPQLNRFRGNFDALVVYAYEVASEMKRRGYKPDITKLPEPRSCLAISVTTGQINYEMDHIEAKLFKRGNPIKIESGPALNTVFYVISGSIEPWEKV